MSFEGHRNFALDTAAIPDQWQHRSGESTSAPTASTSTISQAELRRFKRLKESKQELKQMRDCLLQRVLAGTVQHRSLELHLLRYGAFASLAECFVSLTAF